MKRYYFSLDLAQDFIHYENDFNYCRFMRLVNDLLFDVCAGDCRYQDILNNSILHDTLSFNCLFGDGHQFGVNL